MKTRTGLIVGGIGVVLCIGSAVLLVATGIVGGPFVAQPPVASNPPTPKAVDTPPIVVAERMPPGLATVMDNVRRRLDDGKPLADLLDNERLRQAANRTGGEAAPALDQGFVNMHSPALLTTLTAHLPHSTWGFNAVQWLEPNVECIVLSRHPPTKETRHRPLKMRWWCRVQDGAWRIYDVENILLSGRLSTFLAVGRDAQAAKPTLTEQFSEAYSSLANDNYHGVNNVLKRLEMAKLPPYAQAVLDYWQGVVYAGTWRQPGAEQYFHQALRHDANFAVAHWQLAFLAFQGRNYAVAKDQSLHYSQLVPNDEDGYITAGNAYLEMQDFVTPRELYRSALAQNPNSTDALDGLRVSLPLEDSRELGMRLLKMADPAKALPELVEMALKGNDHLGANGYISAFTQAFPQHPEGWYQQARMHVQQNDTHAAGILLQRILEKAPDARQKELYLHRLLTQAAQRGVGTELYRTLPPNNARLGLQIVADTLLGMGTLVDEPQRLETLLADHRARYPDDVLLDLYQAELHIVHQEYERAEQLLSPLLAKALPPAETARIAQARIRNLITLGQYLRAYEQVTKPSRRETFQTIVSQFHRIGTIQKLAPVIDAHAKADPDDPLLPLWQAELLHHQGDFEGALKALDKFKTQGGDFRAMYLARQSERLIRTLVRLDRVPAAKQQLEQNKGIGFHPLLLLLVRLAEKAPDAERILNNLARDPHLLQQIHDDSDVRFYLEQPAFKGWLEKYPRPPNAPTRP